MSTSILGKLAHVFTLMAISPAPGMAQATEALESRATSDNLVAALADSIGAVRRGGGPLPVPSGVDPRYSDRLNSVSVSTFEEEFAAVSKTCRL